MPPIVLNQDIAAWMVAGRFGTLLTAQSAAAFTVGLDWLSGDADPGDLTYGAFHSLYATNHRYYGFMDLFLDPAARTLDRGLVNALGSAQFRLHPNGVLRGDLHGFWTAAGGRHPIGWELDPNAPATLLGVLRLELGYSIFRASSAGELIGVGPSGEVLQWGYAQLRVGF